MYHYLKWAALGLFLRRNARLLITMVVSVGGIYVADAVYRDLADWAQKTDRTFLIGYFLAAKWVAVALCVGVIVWALKRAGRGEEKTAAEAVPTQKESSALTERKNKIDDRLARFYHTKPLRRKADLILEKKQKR